MGNAVDVSTTALADASLVARLSTDDRNSSSEERQLPLTSSMRRAGALVLAVWTGNAKTAYLA